MKGQLLSNVGQSSSHEVVASFVLVYSTLTAYGESVLYVQYRTYTYVKELLVLYIHCTVYVRFVLGPGLAWS